MSSSSYPSSSSRAFAAEDEKQDEKHIVNLTKDEPSASTPAGKMQKKKDRANIIKGLLQHRLQEIDSQPSEIIPNLWLGSVGALVGGRSTTQAKATTANDDVVGFRLAVPPPFFTHVVRCAGDIVIGKKKEPPAACSEVDVEGIIDVFTSRNDSTPGQQLEVVQNSGSCSSSSTATFPTTSTTKFLDLNMRDAGEFSALKNALFGKGRVVSQTSTTAAADDEALVVQEDPAGRGRDPPGTSSTTVSVLDFIAEGISPCNTCLVCCRQGRSRSVVVTAAFLMLRQQFTLDSALKLIKEKRPVASPNVGFVLCLRQLGREDFWGHDLEAENKNAGDVDKSRSDKEIFVDELHKTEHFGCTTGISTVLVDLNVETSQLNVEKYISTTSSGLGFRV
ncbi:unnamed protein product [Amoebophrya sp. A120]|nr:unnamed protein product [Amoebophrya sp. A120]|eukprot:GSA120T00014858001.1